MFKNIIDHMIDWVLGNHSQGSTEPPRNDKEQALQVLLQVQGPHRLLV